MKYLTLFILALLLSACSLWGLQKPEVHVTQITPRSSTLFEQTFDITLRVTNPNDQALSAQGLVFDVNLAGQKIATGISNQAIQIPARGDGLVTVTVRTSSITWIKQLGKILDSGSGNADYTIDGHIYGLNGWGDIPFKTTGQWKVPGG